MERSPSSASASGRDGERPVDTDGLHAEKTVQDDSLNSNGHDGTSNRDKEKEKKPSFLGKLWKKIDLDLPTALMMMKYVQLRIRSVLLDT